VQGVASDMEINLREMLKLKKELYDIISNHSGQTYEWVEKASDRDYWMTSEEAKVSEWWTKFSKEKNKSQNLIHPSQVFY
jgi:hypothetical protein